MPHNTIHVHFLLHDIWRKKRDAKTNAAKRYEESSKEKQARSLMNPKATIPAKHQDSAKIQRSQQQLEIWPSFNAGLHRAALNGLHYHALSIYDPHGQGSQGCWPH